MEANDPSTTSPKTAPAEISNKSHGEVERLEGEELLVVTATSETTKGEMINPQTTITTRFMEDKNQELYNNN